MKYSHSRTASLWADITYRAGAGGTLSAADGMSPDVQAAGNGSFRTSALIDDGSDQGAENGYTLKTLTDKKLMPKGDANNYYRFDGVFRRRSG